LLDAARRRPELRRAVQQADEGGAGAKGFPLHLDLRVPRLESLCEVLAELAADGVGALDLERDGGRRCRRRGAQPGGPDGGGDGGDRGGGGASGAADAAGTAGVAGTAGAAGNWREASASYS